MTDSNPHQAALFDAPTEDPLPPDPVPIDVHVSIDLHFRCDLAAFVRGNVDALMDYKFLARLDREGFTHAERIDVALHDQIEEALGVMLAPIAGVDPNSVERGWEGHTSIPPEIARRAEDAMTLRYPKRLIGD